MVSEIAEAGIAIVIAGAGSVLGATVGIGVGVEIAVVSDNVVKPFAAAMSISMKASMVAGMHNSEKHVNARRTI